MIDDPAAGCRRGIIAGKWRPERSPTLASIARKVTSNAKAEPALLCYSSPFDRSRLSRLESDASPLEARYCFVLTREAVVAEC